MNIQANEQKYLLLEVERHYGKRVATPYDFEALRKKVLSETGELISVSTFKRLWNYISEDHTVRQSTLDILARYIGKKDYVDFVNTVDVSKYVDSTFFLGKMVRSEDLVKGDELILCWNPDREVRLRYQGDNIYEVLDRGTSKLENGDRFMTRAIIQGQPLYLAEILRNGAVTPAYVAGQKGGITSVSLI